MFESSIYEINVINNESQDEVSCHGLYNVLLLIPKFLLIPFLLRLKIIEYFITDLLRFKVKAFRIRGDHSPYFRNNGFEEPALLEAFVVLRRS